MKRKLHEAILVGGFDLANDPYPETILAANGHPRAASHNQLKWLAAWAQYDRQEGRRTNDHVKEAFPEGSYGITAESGKSYNRAGLTFQQVLYIELPDRAEGQRILEELIALNKEAKYNAQNNPVPSTSGSTSSSNSSGKRKGPVAVITTESDEEDATAGEEMSKAAKPSTINKKQRTSLGAIDDSEGYELNPPKHDFPKKKGEFKSVLEEVHNIAYSNGTYSGMIGKYSRERTGHGVYKWTKGTWKGCVYTGQHMDDKKHGHGEMKFKNGDVYVGEFREDKMCGEGRCEYKNGDVYVGEWRNNEKDGHGRMDWANGDKYEGTWSPNYRYEKGKFRYVNGDVYDGEWDLGVYHGRGKLTKAGGRVVHDGKWINGDIHV